MSRLGWVIGIVAVAGGALLGWQMMKPSPQTDGPSSAAPETAALAAGAPLVEVRLPEALSPEAELGKRAFEAKCAVCHGADAAGQNGVAPPLVHKIYEPSHHGDMAFVLAAQNGVKSHHWTFGDMPPVEGITGAELKSIVTYVRALQRANGIE